MTQKKSSTLAALGEFGLISRITARVTPHESVITGIGDDAAVTALTPGMRLLTSTDMLLEDVHFRRAWHDPFTLGRKSLAVSISDIAAMGGIPHWALLSLAIPPDLPLDFIDDLMRGFQEVATEYNVTLIGGDTCSSRNGLTISVTIMGEQYPDLIVRRSGAQPDDDIWVTGTLGDAAFALSQLENGTAVSESLLSRLLNPAPRVSVALAFAEAGLATAMIDVSDGIRADFGHIADMSGVGGTLRVDDLPLSGMFRSVTADLGAIPFEYALTGGEDYELCFTARNSNREKIVACAKKCGVAATRVGIVTSFSGVTVITRDGTPCTAPFNGFNHFT
ncbi:MAG TPA: thiamine-phosphate kinase [Desulfuromonadales bacterium]|nr:thiamine-phosphate kinase [Desulfuromonadales bacterium]